MVSCYVYRFKPGGQLRDRGLYKCTIKFLDMDRLIKIEMIN